MLISLYNEIEPFAATWLSNLVVAGQIAPGDVDHRSIEELRADDVREYTQAHFFAGLGGWSYALRLAGIPDDFPVWTGSCPCQPFSVAGRGKGSADKRHLWPEWFRLIAECRPPIVFGEQVASKAGMHWFDAVSADLEGAGYAVGAASLPACSVGAPHLRQRLWFVAIADEGRRWAVRLRRDGRPVGSGEKGSVSLPTTSHTGETGTVADDDRQGREQLSAPRLQRRQSGDDVDGLGDTASDTRRRQARGHDPAETGDARPWDLARSGGDDLESTGADGPPLAHTNGPRPQGRNVGTRPHAIGAQSGVPPGPWSDLEWLACSDGKARPAQSGILPLAHGIPGRVGRLRAYGNAIVPQVAAVFIRSALEAIHA